MWINYYNYIVQVAVFLGTNEELPKKEMQEAPKELKPAKITLPIEEKRNLTSMYNPMTTLAELQNMYSEIPMNNFSISIPGSKEVLLEENEVINVAVPNYIVN